MTYGARIAIGIFVIIAIVSVVIGNSNEKVENNVVNNQQIKKDDVMHMFDKIDATNSKNNNIESANNIVEENSIIENQVENEVEVQNTVIGQEEQESKKENTELSDIQKAIELAKEEWAISVNSYDFEAKLITEGIYEVTVSNKTDTRAVAKYNVNVNTEVVVEQ